MPAKTKSVSARICRLRSHLSACSISSNNTENNDLFAPPEQPLRLLTDEELERYASERVVHLSGVLSKQWLQRIEQAVDSFIQPPGPDDLQSMKANEWHRDDAMHAIIMNCPTAHIAQQVLARLAPLSDPAPRGTLKPIRFFYDQTFVKHPLLADDEVLADRNGPLGNTPWHQDITFWPVSGEQIVSVWIALDDTSLENGGLEFVPGSSSFANKYEAVGVGGGKVDRMPFATDSLERVPKINSATTGETDGELSAISFDMKAGDVLLFDTKILHGAPPNLSARPRRGIALRYLGSDVVMDDEKYGPLTSMAPFNTYDETLSNGDKLGGFAYPQVLPNKIPAEVQRRLAGEIKPSKVLMGRWLERMKQASKAAAERGAEARKSLQMR